MRSVSCVTDVQEDLLDGPCFRCIQRCRLWRGAQDVSAGACIFGRGLEADGSADEELESVAQWLSQVEAKLPLSTFKTLAVSCDALGRDADLTAVLHELLSPNYPCCPSSREKDHASWPQARDDCRGRLLPSCQRMLDADSECDIRARSGRGTDDRNRFRETSQSSRRSCSSHANIPCWAFRP